MACEVFRFLSASRDTRSLGTPEPGRAASNADIRQIAETADPLGDDDVLERVLHQNAERMLRLT